MSKEIQIPNWTTGKNLNAVIRNTIGQVLRTDTLLFETYSTANLYKYASGLTEQGTASRFYTGNFPNISAGVYGVTCYEQASGVIGETDIFVGGGDIIWNGFSVGFPIDASGSQKVDISYINGSGVNTSLTQIGANVVQNSDKTGYSLTQSFPSNFSSLAITIGGATTVGTNNDKTGYSLIQSFPTNFSLLSIDTNGRVKIQSGLTTNIAFNNFEFKMVQSTDHLSPATGLTITAQRSIDNGAFSSCSNSPVEVGNGIYSINLSASDLNGLVITLHFTATGADTNDITIITTP